MSALGAFLPSFLLPCSSSELPIIPWRMTVHCWHPAQSYRIIPALNTTDNSDPNTALDCCLTGQRKALKAKNQKPQQQQKNKHKREHAGNKTKQNKTESVIWSLLCINVGWFGFTHWQKQQQCMGQESERAVREHRNRFIAFLWHRFAAISLYST